MPKAPAPLVCLLLILGTSFGCHREMPFDLVPVNGKVAYDDGGLIKAGSIVVTFNPVDAVTVDGVTTPGAQTSVNVADGSFADVTTRRPGDGLIRGRHKVVVLSYDARADGRPVPNKAVPVRYRKVDATSLEVDVTEPNQFIEIKVARR
jgi:hypothetical protein